MKYVRTKDGHLLEIGKTTEYGFVCMPECKTAVHFVENGQEFVDVIRQSDKLEDLCDMFVVWLEGYNMPVEMPLTEKEQYEKMKKIVSVGIKAKMNIWLKVAIWTDKGLIYVAKINGEGELELL